MPDLSRMEVGVQAQMRDADASLTAKKNGSSTSPGELATAYGEMGILLLAAAYPDAAEPCYLNANALAADDKRWPYYLGHLYRTKGDAANAARWFERALQLQPSDVATLVWLGTVDLDLGRPEAAEPYFARALSVEPRSVAAHESQSM